MVIGSIGSDEAAAASQPPSRYIWSGEIRQRTSTLIVWFLSLTFQIATSYSFYSIFSYSKALTHSIAKSLARMESVIADSTAKSLELVSAYAGQLSRVFHRCQTILLIDSSEAVQDHVNIINSILRTLNEIQSLLQGKNVTNPNRMLSEEGFRYVNVLNLECFSILQKIAPTVAKAGVKRERKKKGKNGKKTKVAIIEPVVPTQSKLDEERLMNDLENVIWYRVLDDVDAYIERLKEVQLHLLLVYQVVTVGSLSRDL